MTDPTPVDYRTAPPKLATAATCWQAWWDGNDEWFGSGALYADRDTAQRYTVADYIGEEYSWTAADPADEAPEVTLTWDPAPALFGEEPDRWHLSEDGQRTGVYLYRKTIYTPEEGIDTATQVAPHHTPDPEPRLSTQEDDALWDAIAIPGGGEPPTFADTGPRACGATAVFWPDAEACEAVCTRPFGHQPGDVHEDETLGEWREDELTTHHPDRDTDPRSTP